MAAKVPRDMADDIEEYRAEHDLNTSQAMRRLVEDGLEAQEPDRSVPLSHVMMVSGAFLLGAAYVTATGYAGEMGIAMVVLAFLLESARVRQYVQVLRARFTRRTGEDDNATTT